MSSKETLEIIQATATATAEAFAKAFAPIVDKLVSAAPATAPAAPNQALQVYEDAHAANAAWSKPVSLVPLFWAIGEIPCADVDALRLDGTRRRAGTARFQFAKKPDGRGVRCVGFSDARDDEEFTQHCLIETIREQGALPDYLKAKANPDDGQLALIIRAANPTAKHRRWMNGFLPATRSCVSVGAPSHRYVPVSAVRAFCISFGPLIDADGREVNDLGEPIATASDAAAAE